MSKVFAENLRYYRTLSGMTQADLAKSVNITRSAVNNYEAEKSEPSFDVLCRFSRVLGVELEDLLSERKQEYVRRIQVTDEEWAVVQAFREADSVYQTVALKLLRDNKRR